MGVISNFLGMAFGSNRNVIVETAEMFRENAERAGEREAAAKDAVLQQFAAEFQRVDRGWFDRCVDGLNRLPRPLMAFGTLGLVAAAMANPAWFGQRMAGLTLVPEPLWWLMGAIVSFYFGARHQIKGHEFQRAVAQTLAGTPVSARKVEPSRAPDDNAALREWRAMNGV